MFGLRILVGSALIVLAITEKLARPDLALEFLERYPAFNILATIGFDVADLTFVRIAGGVELLFGLLIISGALPQVVVVAAGIPFNATLFFLGTSELIGHLPIYGAMLVLLVYGSDPRIALVVRWLPGRGPYTRLQATRPPIRTPDIQKGTVNALWKSPFPPRSRWTDVLSKTGWRRNGVSLHRR